MVRMIREYHERTGYAVGFKPAGGIRTAKQALEWLLLMKEELGDRWLKPDLFRFGASALLTDIERQLEHFVTGRYCGRAPPPDGLTMHMATVAEIFETMEYGPAPESDEPARRVARHSTTRRSATSSAARGRSRRKHVRGDQPGDRQALAQVTQGIEDDVDAAVTAARKALPAWQALGGHGRARYLYALARMVQKHSRLFAVLEIDGQRQAHPRDARHRHPARRAPLLSPRRLGAAARDASSPATTASASSARSFRGTSRC